MTSLQTLKQNINSLSAETKISLSGLVVSIYLLARPNLALSDIIIPVAIAAILFILIFKNNDNLIRIIADGAVFLAGSMTLLSFYGAAIAFDRTDAVYSESYFYPLIFFLFFISFYLFFVGVNKIKENMKIKIKENTTHHFNLKENQKIIGFTLLCFILTVLSAAAIPVFENPLFLSKFTAFFMLGIVLPLFVFYLMYVLLFWKIIPSVQSIIWLPYLLFAVDVLTMWIRLVHPIGEYFPKIDLTFINAHANDFHEVISAGIIVSFLFMAGIFIFSRVFSILKPLLQKQHGWTHFKKELKEQSSEIKISYYGLGAIIFFAFINRFISIFRTDYFLNKGSVHSFIIAGVESKIRSLSSDFELYLALLLICLFIGVSIFLGEQILKKQKIRFSFRLFPIIFYSVISFLIIFLLLILDVFIFIPLLNAPPEGYIAPPILIVFMCQIIAFIIYRYLIRKKSFKPTDILLTAGFVFLTFPSMVIALLFIAPIAPTEEPQFYVVLRTVSFFISLVVFEIGAWIITKIKKSCLTHKIEPEQS